MDAMVGTGRKIMLHTCRIRLLLMRQWASRRSLLIFNRRMICLF